MQFIMYRELREAEGGREKCYLCIYTNSYVLTRWFHPCAITFGQAINQAAAHLVTEPNRPVLGGFTIKYPRYVAIA